MKFETNILKKVSHIARYLALAVLLHLLLALAPAMAQNVVHNGDTSTIQVETQPGDSYYWEFYSDSTVNFVVAPADAVHPYADFVGATNSSTVEILWKKPGTYFFKVHALNITGCTDNMKMGIVKVLEALPTAVISPPADICEGGTATLVVTFTGTGPWKFDYTSTDINGTTTRPWPVADPGTMDNPYTLIVNPAPIITTDYQIISVSDKFGINTTGSNTVTQTVNPLPKPSSIYHR